MDEYIEGVVVDVCTRTILCVSNLGNEKVAECDTYKEFLGMLEFIKATLNEKEIIYADLALTEYGNA